MASFKGRLTLITISKLKEQEVNRKKQKRILHSPGHKYTFLSSGEHVYRTTGDKRFHQHTVTLKSLTLFKKFYNEAIILCLFLNY